MDTIVAVATPPGCGGVGVVRISGPLAYEIGLQITAQTALTPRYAHYLSFYSHHQMVLDQGLAIYFKAPHSFTGEDVIELQGHGSPVVLDQLVQSIVAFGARIARPGEFSERAFLNDKMDLTQAEAIADLIHAHSVTAARMAMRSLQGEFSAKITALNESLIRLRMYVEAAMDFPEEEIDVLSDGHIAASLNALIESLQQLRGATSQGVMMREGLSVAIVGPPNAGKSTLMNRLAERDVAIVTDIAGTTRDVMRERVLLDDVPIHVMDTAGLRETSDMIEQEGIKRAWRAAAEADVVLLVFDASLALSIESHLVSLREALGEHVPILVVLNKVDKAHHLSDSIQYVALDFSTVSISAKTGEGIDALKVMLKRLVGYQPTEGQFLARRRHLEALDGAYTLLLNGQSALSMHRAGELLAEDLRLAQQQLCEITGEFTSDDLLGHIFSSFCIGK